MIKLKNNSAELHFNFHRFFNRSAEGPLGHPEHYIDYLTTNEAPEKAEEIAKRDFIYSAAWIAEVMPFGDGEVVRQTMSSAYTKTIFGNYFREHAEELKMPFPFGFVNFDLFNGFKCASNVSGRILLSFEGDHFLLQGEFVTLPPARLESFNPTRKIYSNEDIKKVVAEFSDIFRQAADLKE